MKFHTQVLSSNGKPVKLKACVSSPMLGANNRGLYVHIHLYDHETGTKIGTASLEYINDKYKLNSIENLTRNTGSKYSEVGTALLEIMLRVNGGKPLFVEPSGDPIGFYFKKGFRYQATLATGEPIVVNLSAFFGLQLKTLAYKEFVEYCKKQKSTGVFSDRSITVIQSMEQFEQCKKFASFKLMKDRKEIDKLSVPKVLELVPEMLGLADFEVISANEYCRRQIVFREHNKDTEYNSFEVSGPGTGCMLLEGQELANRLKQFNITSEEQCLTAGNYIIFNGIDKATGTEETKKAVEPKESEKPVIFSAKSSESSLKSSSDGTVQASITTNARDSTLASGNALQTKIS